MYTPKETGRTFTLCGKTFNIYSLDGFKFDEGLDITEEQGLYCFVFLYHTNISETRYYLHYLGKAEGFNGINGRLVSAHDKFSELKNDVTHIGIHICQQEENPKDIESMLLNHYKFTYNIQENQPDVDLPTNVAED